MMRFTLSPVLALLALVFTQDARPQNYSYPGWLDNAATRVKASAILQTLNATLLSNPSATQTLTRWCGDHHMAAEPRVRALRELGVDKPASEAIRQQLGVSAAESVGYRRVQLVCGDHVLSVADNWYVRSRLSPAMNALLDSSDTPFGVVVRELNFSRKTQRATVLWEPLPHLWEMHEMQETHEMQESQGQSTARTEPAPLPIPNYVLQHTALLYRADGMAFSFLIETYTREVFAFALNGAQ